MLSTEEYIRNKYKFKYKFKCRCGYENNLTFDSEIYKSNLVGPCPMCKKNNIKIKKIKL